jgi:hypothetical protein
MPEFGEQRRRGRRSGAIVQGEILATAIQGSGHRQQRRKTDAAGDQNITSAVVVERQVISRRGDVHLATFTQALVSPDRSAAARRLALDGDLVFGAVVGIAAQRILPHATVRHAQIDMRTGGPFRKRWPKRMHEL